MASIATRDARRLPSVPGKTRGQRILVPTYRHAVNWFNKNRETLDLITGLLEVHPSLIYQEPCTKLRNFLSAVHTDTSTRISDVFRHSDINDQHQVNSSILNGSETQKSMSVSNVPEILVSKPEDENSSLSDPCSTQRGDCQCVCICGDVDNEKWHRLVVNLTCRFQVRCHPAEVDTHGVELGTGLDMHAVGTFVYLLDSKSFLNERCRDALRKAINLNIPLVFVRDMEFNMDHVRNEQTFQEREDFIDETLLNAGANSPLMFSRKSRINDLCIHRPIRYHHLSSRSVDSGFDPQSPVPGKQSPVSGKQSPVSGKQPCSSYDHSNDDDIDRLISDEFGLALTYHHLYHSSCINRIVNVIADKRHNRDVIRPSSGLPFSTYTFTDPAIRCQRKSTSFSQMESEHRYEGPEIERRGSRASVGSHSLDSIESTSSETMFIVSRPLDSQTPVVVRWPREVEAGEAPISNSPSIDSFGFQDIDLSKSVNELDWFDESE
ncbi:uncharacterized protein LOC128213956 [Mya arenaria]|uniref:uncharacterized protein LOC128207261 n=1 Tax=Mya arenaria TaxID=6604 RepID=UPI0022E05B30|nr:uncharacterized protein LOC128207261 [Mya arenaria]XP_052776051.1 uncharacterized protein LOC128213956 [Mya arenaria]